MYTARGRLIFDKSRNAGKTIPIHNMLVKLYDHDTLSSNDLLEVGCTDLNGYFKIIYDPAKAGWGDKPDLKIQLYDLIPSYKNGKLVQQEVLVVGFDHPVVNDVTISNFDFGEIEVKYWEYRPVESSYSPRLYINADAGFPIAQSAPPGRMAELRKRIAQSLLYRQVGFPLNETQLMVKDGTGEPRSDEYLVEMALNGFYPCKFKKAGDGRLFIDFSWAGMNQTGVRYAPDTTAYFRVADGAKTLKLDSIVVTERDGYARGYAPHMKKPVEYTAENCKGTEGLWDNVKKLWRINYLLFGEAYEHIATFHYNVEQYILPFMRHVRKNPIRNLLFPHFNGTVWINEKADPLMTDPEGLVPLTSAATPDAVEFATREAFGKNNWLDWRPRKPITEDHRFAKVQQKYWEMLEVYVAEYFKEHAADIEKEWAEIKCMSDELVGHATPYTQDEAVYTDDHEVNKASTQHETVNGVTVAVSAITKDEALGDANRQENMDRLQQLCRYLIMFTTMKHCWTNDEQYLVGGEPDFCSFGVDFNILEKENIHKPPLTKEICDRLIADSWFTVANKWGYIMADEARDMNPNLKKHLEDRRLEFKAIGYDIDVIRCCINT